MEKRMKEESDKRKSIKTYKEIVEEKYGRYFNCCLSDEKNVFQYFITKTNFRVN